MMKDLLLEKNCRIVDEVKDWKEAVHLSLEPLIEQGCCTAEYEQAVYDSTAELGPYYIMTDNMALIHASNKAGVFKTQMAVTVLRKPVQFEAGGKSVRILIALTAVDAESHIDGMAAIIKLFGDENRSEEIMNAGSGAEIYKMFTGAAEAMEEE